MMGEFIFGTNGTVPVCKKHDEDRDMCCEDCKTIFCVTCGQKDHKDHNWGSVKKISIEKRKEIPKVSDGIRECVQEISEGLTFINQLESEQEKRHSGQIKKLVKQQDDMVSEITKVTNANIEKSKEIYNRYHQKLTTVKSRLLQQKEELELRAKFLNDQASTVSGYHLMETNHEIDSLIKDVSQTDLTSHGFLPCFFKGVINLMQLKTMYGCLMDPDLIKVSKLESFKNFSDTVVSIHCIADDLAWMHGWDSNAYLLTNKGVVRQSIPMESLSNDFVVLDNGDHIFTDFENEEVKRLNKSGELTTIVSLKPLTPIGITKTLDDDLLVAMVESYTFKVSKSSRRVIKRMTYDGIETDTYEYDKDGIRLFTKPHRIIQNYNHDICVIDQTGNASGMLRVLGADGSVKFDYRGHYVRKKFDPRGLVCDVQCNIIITDCHHNLIHLLSPFGEFIRYLVTKQQAFDSPYSVDLYKSYLWVGGRNGDITIYRYQIDPNESET